MKTTLIIDGNWLLMSRSFIMFDYFKKDNPEEVKVNGQQKLQEFMASSINVVINRFKNTVNNIILVSDGGSWRKHVARPKDMYTETYKGNREHDSEYDWDYIFNSLNHLGEQFNKLGITYTHSFDVEGDDWAWYWSRYLNEKGINVIIWSSDNDLKQLLQLQNGAFTGWYNDKNGLFLPESLKEKPVDDIDFFLNPDVSNPTLERIKYQAQAVSYVNPDLIVMEKIVCGDSGDNIKPLLRKVQNGRTYGIGQKDWEKIRESLNISNIMDFYSAKDQIINALLDLKKFKGYGIVKQDVEDMFEYNKKMVWLNGLVIPDSVKEDMSSSDFDYKEYDLNNIYNNYKIMAGEDTTKIEDIFSGVL